MKKIPGRVLIVLLSISFSLFAFEGVEYELNISSKTPYVKEPVTIEMNIRQTSRNGVLDFEFSPIKNESFDLLFLGVENLQDKNGSTFIKYKYVLFALKEGEVEVGFNFIIKSATKEEVKEAAIGARNVLRVVNTKNTKIKLDSLKLSVKKLPQDVKIVGKYELKADFGTVDVERFSQLNVTYTLLGEGYPPSFSPFANGIGGVDLFEEKESFDDKLFHKRVYSYAILADKNFTIPKVFIRAFDPVNNRAYNLVVKERNITVKDLVAQDILDKSDTFDKDIDFDEYKSFFAYFLWFLSGFFAALFLPTLKRRFFKPNREKSAFIQRVKDTKDFKSLLKIVILEDQKLYKKEIERIERCIYEAGKDSLSEIKKSILKKIDDASYSDR